MAEYTNDRKKLDVPELVIRIISILAFMIYLYCVLYITLIDRSAGMRRHVLRPLWEVRTMLRSGDYIYWSGQIGGNLLMLFPLGFLLPIISNRFKSVALTTLAGFTFSFLIESIQYYTGRGMLESDDLIHNTIGALAGCILCLAIDKLLKSNTAEYE